MDAAAACGRRDCLLVRFRIVCRLFFLACLCRERRDTGVVGLCRATLTG